MIQEQPQQVRRPKWHMSQRADEEEKEGGVTGLQRATNISRNKILALQAFRIRVVFESINIFSPTQLLRKEIIVSEVAKVFFNHEHFDDIMEIGQQHKGHDEEHQFLQEGSFPWAGRNGRQARLFFFLSVKTMNPVSIQNTTR